MSALVLFGTSSAETITIPSNTMIYVETDQPVSGKTKQTQEGQVVRSTVWRDVEVNGHVVIKAGTPALVRVDSIKGGRIAGRKGKMTLGAYDTTAIDGTRIDLSGGYLKEGKGRIALTATLAAVVFLPLIFIKGKSADLPRGTVFDAYAKQNIDIDVSGQKKAGQIINLSGAVGPRLQVDVLYDELTAVEKPEMFAFSITAPTAANGNFAIDTINNAKIDPLKLETTSEIVEGDKSTWRGEVKIKDLGKDFKKGINTFEIASTINGERVGEEVILDIQF
jgi:hypothetical protein